MLSWSRAMIRAMQAGAAVKEVCSLGNLIGLEINGKVVLPNVHGWYDTSKVDAAI